MLRSQSSAPGFEEISIELYPYPPTYDKLLKNAFNADADSLLLEQFNLANLPPIVFTIKLSNWLLEQFNWQEEAGPVKFTFKPSNWLLLQYNSDSIVQPLTFKLSNWLLLLYNDDSAVQPLKSEKIKKNYFLFLEGHIF